MAVVWICCAVIAVLVMSGCTQTATVVDPMRFGCVVSCKPGEECKAEFRAYAQTGEDKSVLLGE